MQSAKAITNEDVELEEKRLAERQAKLDEGYKLYPGVGWVKNESIEEPIYTNHPDTGEKIIDLEATMKDRKDGNVELDGCVWPDTSGWNIADSKHEPSKTMSYAAPDWQVPTEPVENEGATFYFNVFESFGGVILQLVLQYGYGNGFW